MDPADHPVVLWPLAVYAAGVVTVIISMLGLSYFLGQRNPRRTNVEPYESGISSTGTARIRLSADFYLVAMFFVIFDLESVYVVAWATAVQELGWFGYGAISIFLGSVIASFAYLWRLGALEPS